MKETLRIIGCRAGSPTYGNPASGTLLTTSEGTILIDCGPGVLVNLTEQEVENLIGVIISHRHADHCLDLMALAYRVLFPSLQKPIPLFGPPSLLEMIKSYDDLFGIPSLPTLKRPIATAFSFSPVIPGDSFTVAGSFIFETALMHHPVETMAVKSVDFNVVVTADGSYTEGLQKLCTGCDILIAEATYPDDEGRHLEEHGHMTAAVCASLAKKAEVKHLIVTHLSDPADSEVTIAKVKKLFHGRLSLARPGLTLDCYRPSLLV